MAKIRFEDVTISAKAIELEGIEDPSVFLKGLGLEGAKVHEPIPTEPEVEEIHEEEDAPPVERELKKKSPRRREAPKKQPTVQAEQLVSAKRLRDIIEAFVEAGVTESELIISQCESMKADVPILKRIGDIPERIGMAVDRWKKDNVA